MNQLYMQASPTTSNNWRNCGIIMNQEITAFEKVGLIWVWNICMMHIWYTPGDRINWTLRLIFGTHIGQWFGKSEQRRKKREIASLKFPTNISKKLTLADKKTKAPPPKREQKQGHFFFLKNISVMQCIKQKLQSTFFNCISENKKEALKSLYNKRTLYNLLTFQEYGDCGFSDW